MSSKRAPKNINDNGRKKKKVTTFNADVQSPFVYTENMLTATIFGKPQSYKYTGGNHGIRYDQQKELKAEFVRALFTLYTEHSVEPMAFGQDDVEVNVTFVFARRNGKIPNNVNNLSKKILDCLCIQHNKIRVCNNDNQVIKLCIEKKYGDVPLTKFTVVRATRDNDIVIDLTGSADSYAQPRVEI